LLCWPTAAAVVLIMLKGRGWGKGGNATKLQMFCDCFWFLATQMRRLCLNTPKFMRLWNRNELHWNISNKHAKVCTTNELKQRLL